MTIFIKVNLVMEAIRLDVSWDSKHSIPSQQIQSFVFGLRLQLIIEMYLELGPAHLPVQSITLLD